MKKDNLLLAAEMLRHLRSSSCLPPARFWKAARGAALTESERRHLASCERCRAHQAGVAATLLAPVALVLVCAELLRRLRPAFRGNDEADSAPCEEYHFEDGRLSGTLSLDQDSKHCLELTHTGLPPGTLLRVRMEDPDGTGLAWCRFGVLRQGLPHPIVKMVVEDALLAEQGPQRLAVETLPSAAALVPGDEALLEDSFAAARREDPLAVPAWRQMARQALDGFVAVELRGLMREIAQGGEGT